jgi:hypothetical protein
VLPALTGPGLPPGADQKILEPHTIVSQSQSPCNLLANQKRSVRKFKSELIGNTFGFNDKSDKYQLAARW